jgi:N-acetylglutamate synthase-like GNAT family acetyltransferase
MEANLNSKFKIIDDIKKMDFVKITAMLKDTYWSKGIGQAMIKYILNHSELKDVYQWLLITKDAHGVYRKVGFKNLESPKRWMEIRNPRPDR